MKQAPRYIDTTIPALMEKKSDYIRGYIYLVCKRCGHTEIGLPVSIGSECKICKNKQVRQ